MTNTEPTPADYHAANQAAEQLAMHPGAEIPAGLSDLVYEAVHARAARLGLELSADMTLGPDEDARCGHDRGRERIANCCGLAWKLDIPAGTWTTCTEGAEFRMDCRGGIIMSHVVNGQWVMRQLTAADLQAENEYHARQRNNPR